VDEIDLLARVKGGQRRHYLQPNRLMYNIVKLSHNTYFQDERTNIPVTRNAPPPIGAIHRQ
jgi:hypothetical protein